MSGLRFARGQDQRLRREERAGPLVLEGLEGAQGARGRPRPTVELHGGSSYRHW